ncbi:hypothetical protein BDK51DRAFT_35210, partial [Blyttiomyces helicus]
LFTFFLQQNAQNEYALLALGKNGEPHPNEVMHVSFTHRWCTTPITTSLKTNKEGIIWLGKGARSWDLFDSHLHQTTPLEVDEGVEIIIPVEGTFDGLGPYDWALIEMGGADNEANHANVSHLARPSPSRSAFEIPSLPAGEYTFTLISPQNGPATRSITVRPRRDHPKPQPRALRVLPIPAAAADGSVTLHVAGNGPNTRVHCFVSSFVGHTPSVGFGDEEEGGNDEDVVDGEVDGCVYGDSRLLGAEVDYVLGRASEKRSIGCLMRKPGVVLDLRNIRKTSVISNELDAPIPRGSASSDEDMGFTFEDDGYGRASNFQAAACRSGYGAGGFGAGAFAVPAQGDDFPNLDFLDDKTTAILNLCVPESGEVKVNLAPSPYPRLLHIIAADDRVHTTRRVPLPAEHRVGVPTRSTVLSPTWPATAHVVEDIAIAIIDAPVPPSAVVVSTVAALHRIASSLATNADTIAQLAEFRFITTWGDLSDADKRTQYATHVCHELNLFLKFKDPAFFAAVVAPHLRDKAERDPIDVYLLADVHACRHLLATHRAKQLNAAERVLGAKIAGCDAPTRRWAADAARGGASVEAVRRRARFVDVALGGRIPAVASPTMGFGLFGSAPDSGPKFKKASMVKSRRTVEVNALYEKIEQMEELGETFYWKLSREDGAGRVPVNPFWRDLAEHDGVDGFLSLAVGGKGRNV